MKFVKKLWEYRSSHPVVFLEKGVLKKSSKFTGEHPCRSIISGNSETKNSGNSGEGGCDANTVTSANIKTAAFDEQVLGK